MFYPLSEDSSLLVSESIDTHNSNQNIELKYQYVRQSGTIGAIYSAEVGDRIPSQDGIIGIEIMWNCTCVWSSSLVLYQHYDAGDSFDAPSALPSNKNVDNSSWPLVEMNGETYSGELALFMDDMSDIVRVETHGWNESIHLVDVIVEGDISKLTITIWDIEQDSWQILDTVSATYSMNSIKTSLEVGLGTHFVRIEYNDINNTDTDIVNWQIRISTAVLDEGEEPWFPPSEKVKDAANWFYWMIGGLMLLPVIIFLINLKREASFASKLQSELSFKRNRLSWLKEKLDKGEFVQKDLSKSLKAVASLEWETAISVWGTPKLRHHTYGIDLAIWNLDERICEGWPLLIGINPQESNWEVAALKFESPEGEAWLVENVNPKLLSRNNEIFLDVLSKGSRFFIQVELSGKASSLDLHLSGMVNGEPMAAKPSQTINREIFEEE